MTDFDVRLLEARRNGKCAQCGHVLVWPAAPRGGRFCSTACRLKFRDARRYAENPEAARARTRKYYAENREAILARAAEKRKQEAAAGKATPREPRHCVECGVQLTGNRKLVCGQRCQHKRWAKTNPEAARERERKKYARKLERRKEQQEASETP